MHGVAMPAPGQVFAGDYRVVEPLSSGGMGAVFVVEQLSTGKRRAMKVMHPELVADDELRRRFEQEARVGARIESAHVVDVQAAGIDPTSGMPWLVMELLTGEDLAARLEREGGLSLHDAREIFEQLCHALASAHRAGIVHRDLKPENVFLGRGRHAGARLEVKVLDFGIAKLVEESGTRSTAAVGSPAWMAPEQTDRATIDVRADVWALGLLAYCVLTGRIFWRKVDQKWVVLLREIVMDPLPTASQRASEQGCAGRLPPGFDGWFARCVARDRSARFANAIEAWDALRPVLAAGSQTGSAPPPNAAMKDVVVAAPTLPDPSRALAAHPRSARPVLIAMAVLAVLLVLGAVGLAVALMPPTPDGPVPSSGTIAHPTAPPPRDPSP